MFKHLKTNCNYHNKLRLFLHHKTNVVIFLSRKDVALSPKLSLPHQGPLDLILVGQPTQSLCVYFQVPEIEDFNTRGETTTFRRR